MNSTEFEPILRSFYSQGFQLLTTTFDGFGGFARSLIEDIRDEYPKTPILTFGFSNPIEVTKNVVVSLFP